MIFQYTVDPNAEEPIMLLDRHVGYDAVDGPGIMGDQFQRELLALDGMGKKRIQVWINSPGGVVSDGYAIYNAILKSKTNVDTYDFGVAASISGVIFQAGRKRIMADYSWLMYHKPFGGTGDVMEVITDSLITMVATRSGKPEDEIRAIMKKDTYILADEAYAAGLCDQVESSIDYNKKRVTATEPQAFYREANTILNSILQPHKKTKMSLTKITNKLGLVPEASEESIVTAIEQIENKAKKTADTLTEKECELENAKNKVTDLEKEVKDLKDQIKAKEDAEVKAKADLEAKNKKEAEAKAKTMIEGFAADGRIKNEAEVIASWTEKAVADYDGVKSLIENLPVNKTAAKINVSNTGKNSIGSVVANKMAEKLVEAHGK